MSIIFRINCSVSPGWSASAASNAIFNLATAPLFTLASSSEERAGYTIEVRAELFSAVFSRSPTRSPVAIGAGDEMERGEAAPEGEPAAPSVGRAFFFFLRAALAAGVAT